MKWIKDIKKMQNDYGITEWVHNNPDKLGDYLKFRINFLREEVNEAVDAFDTNNKEEVVDAMIDLIVVALGTLVAYEVDIDKAWNTVHKANMTKKIGVKDSRPNKLGIPDLVKPKGWKGPDHKGNYGLLPDDNGSKINHRYALTVLEECGDLMRRKGEDYNNIPHADYYPDGIRDIYYMMHHKMLRIKSVLTAGDKPNYESIGDSARDLINYAAFFVEYAEGKMQGQHANSTKH